MVHKFNTNAHSYTHSRAHNYKVDILEFIINDGEGEQQGIYWSGFLSMPEFGKCYFGLYIYIYLKPLGVIFLSRSWSLSQQADAFLITEYATANEKNNNTTRCSGLS